MLSLDYFFATGLGKDLVSVRTVGKKDKKKTVDKKVTGGIEQYTGKLTSA
jgi:hypothetical protein